jgi:hypothetical protein
MAIGGYPPTARDPGSTREHWLAFAPKAENLERLSTVYGRRGRLRHPPGRPYLEPVTALAAGAVATTRARLGAPVFIVGICDTGVGAWNEAEDRACPS